MNAVIFLGPSLPLDLARGIFPDAHFLPPARQSDLVSAITTYHPDVIGLVDGEFGQSLSVWHKEILFALDAGIAVYGASSMGALRAAECAEYGMIGVGEIYRMFSTGELNDDDEVALAHGQDEVGYRMLSEPMVNLRATLQHARDEGAIDAPTCERLVGMAKAMYFPERTFPAVCRAALSAGVPEATIDCLKRFVETGYVDLKRQDAVRLLETIRDLPPDAPRQAPTFDFNRTFLFETLYQRDRTVPQDGIDIPLAAISNHAALHMPDFHDFNFHALNRTLVGIFADLMEVEVADRHVRDEGQRFRLRHGLIDDTAMSSWLRRNHLNEEEFAGMMREMAKCRAMHRWLVTRLFMQRTAQIVLDELRHTGRYEKMAEETAESERILSLEFAHFRETDFHDLDISQLVLDHMRATTMRMDTAYPVWAEEAGFHTRDDLRVELLRARLVREFRDSMQQELATALATDAPAVP